MFVHSYQSYLWNAATSERCKRFGTEKAVKGDLVLKPETAAEHDGMDASGAVSCIWQNTTLASERRLCAWGMDGMDASGLVARI